MKLPSLGLFHKSTNWPNLNARNTLKSNNAFIAFLYQYYRKLEENLFIWSKILIISIFWKTGSDFGAEKWSWDICNIKTLVRVLVSEVWSIPGGLRIYFLKHETIFGWSYECKQASSKLFILNTMGQKHTKSVQKQCVIWFAPTLISDCFCSKIYIYAMVVPLLRLF